MCDPWIKLSAKDFLNANTGVAEEDIFAAARVVFASKLVECPGWLFELGKTLATAKPSVAAPQSDERPPVVSKEMAYLWMAMNKLDDAVNNASLIMDVIGEKFYLATDKDKELEMTEAQIQHLPCLVASLDDALVKAKDDAWKAMLPFTSPTGVRL